MRENLGKRLNDIEKRLLRLEKIVFTLAESSQTYIRHPDTEEDCTSKKALIAYEAVGKELENLRSDLYAQYENIGKDEKGNKHFKAVEKMYDYDQFNHMEYPVLGGENDS